MFNKSSSIHIEGIVNLPGYREFEAGVEGRIAALKERLTTASDMGQVVEYQCAIKELRYLLKSLAAYKRR